MPNPPPINPFSSDSVEIHSHTDVLCAHRCWVSWVLGLRAGELVCERHWLCVVVAVCSAAITLGPGGVHGKTTFSRTRMTPPGGRVFATPSNGLPQRNPRGAVSMAYSNSQHHRSPTTSGHSATADQLSPGLVGHNSCRLTPWISLQTCTTHRHMDAGCGSSGPPQRAMRGVHQHPCLKPTEVLLLCLTACYKALLEQSVPAGDVEHGQGLLQRIQASQVLHHKGEGIMAPHTTCRLCCSGASRGLGGGSLCP